MNRCRLYGLLSLALLGGYAVGVALAAGASGVAFDAVTPWPLGGGPGTGGLSLRGISLLLGLGLGWGVPGLSLALLSDVDLRGSALLGRALGLGCGYVLVTGLGHAALTGHAPGRLALLLLLALPPALSTLRRGTREPIDLMLPALAALMIALSGLLWGKLHREAMNGDGTEAYELARSLDSHPAPYWDLERWEGPGKFGTPAVNPFVTNSFLVNAQMALLGRGELAARLPLVPVAVLCGVLGAGRLLRASGSGAAYAAVASVLFLLWNSYYVGYEPPFTDLAEPAFTDTFMTALWLAGFGEVAAGSTFFGIAFLVLASGVLYSAPVLATAALSVLAFRNEAGRRAVRYWLAAVVLAGALALAYGIASGNAADWFRQVKSEYWHDLVEQGRRTASLPILVQFVLMTGALPLVAALRWRSLSAPSLALVATGATYLAIVLASSYKNLHYLAPLPFLLMTPALEASGIRARVGAMGLILVSLALSWPDDRSIHRETAALGQASCVEGMTYEEASLGADAVYDAFDRPGHAGRLAVGKHSFVRYALELGGGIGCTIRLARAPREGWTVVAGEGSAGGASVSVRDVDAYVRWRFSVPPVSSSWLFPRRAPASLPVAARRWIGQTTLASEPGAALVLNGFDHRAPEGGGVVRPLLRMDGPYARLLVPAPAGTTVVLEAISSEPGATLGLRVNGADAGDVAVAGGFRRVTLPSGAPSWRDGWNVIELLARGAAAGPVVALEALEVRVADGAAP